MNRRLPRVALLVVLLVSSVGLFALGGDSQARLALAQGDQCTSLAAAPEVEIVTHDLALEGTDERAKVQTIELKAGEILEVHETYLPRVWVDDGSVTLTVCTDDTVVITPGSTGPVEIVPGPDNTKVLGPGDTVSAVARTGVFYLTGSTTGSSVSRVVVMYTKSPLTLYASCGGAGC